MSIYIVCYVDGDEIQIEKLVHSRNEEFEVKRFEQRIWQL